jgi:hypothetical protein
MKRRFENFAQFYPFYLSEHANRVSRRLHFAGTSGVIGCLLTALVSGNGWWYLAAFVCGYGFAWVGHFFFERNRPATFRHPIYSFIGDWAMYVDIWRGKVRL